MSNEYNNDARNGEWRPDPEYKRGLEQKWRLKYGEPGWFPNAINPETGLPRSRQEENPLEDE